MAAVYIDGLMDKNGDLKFDMSVRHSCSRPPCVLERLALFGRCSDAECEVKRIPMDRARMRQRRRLINSDIVKEK